MEEHTGRCLCGAIRFRARGRPRQVTHCYCSMCRRFGGAAYQTWVWFPTNDVAFEGARAAEYRSSPQAARGFCGVCGSSLYLVYDSQPGTLWLTAGTLDVPDAVEPGLHWCTKDKVRWVAIADDLPRS